MTKIQRNPGVTAPGVPSSPCDEFRERRGRGPDGHDLAAQGEAAVGPGGGGGGPGRLGGGHTARRHRGVRSSRRHPDGDRGRTAGLLHRDVRRLPRTAAADRSARRGPDRTPAGLARPYRAVVRCDRRGRCSAHRRGRTNAYVLVDFAPGSDALPRFCRPRSMYRRLAPSLGRSEEAQGLCIEAQVFDLEPAELVALIRECAPGGVRVSDPRDAMYGAPGSGSAPHE